MFPWVFGIVQVLFLLWVVSTLWRGASPTCDSDGVCGDAASAGWTIGVGLALAFELVVWAVVDTLLGIGYTIFKR